MGRAGSSNVGQEIGRGRPCGPGELWSHGWQAVRHRQRDRLQDLVDGPKSVNGEDIVQRHVMPLKRLSITNIKCDIMPGAKLKVLEKAIADAGVAKKWAASSWSKGIAKKAAKANMNDFDRFTMMVARKTRARVVNKELKAM